MRMRTIFLAGLLLFLAAPFTYLPGSGSADGLGCIEVQSLAYNRGGTLLDPSPVFTFHLDGRRSLTNNSAGRVRFTGVPSGTHRVTETLPPGWGFLTVTPSNGTVTVRGGSDCAYVTFSNKQVGYISNIGTCQDGRDNDGDARTDRSDADCHTDGNVSNSASYDPNRYENTQVTQTYGCADGVDNDGDGRIDRNDPNCHTDGRVTNAASYSRYRSETSSYTTAYNNAECADGYDNDRDGRIDYPSDAQCDSYRDDSEARTYAVTPAYYPQPAPRPAYRPAAVSSNNSWISTFADLAEALPGDTVWYTVRVTNDGTTRGNLRIEAYYDPAKMTVSNAGGGTISGDTIRWHLGTFAANETRTVRFAATVKTTLPHGSSVRVNTKMWASDVERTSGHTLWILSHLPQTGIDLAALQAAASPTANPLAFLSMMLMGVGAGGGLMKKIYPL